MQSVQLSGMIMLVIVAIIKLQDRGPAFIRRVHVGPRRHGVRVLKFRAMHVDAEAGGLKLPTREAGFPVQDHQRSAVTRIGTCLCSTSLDELSQLINVLKGG